ncbi:MAG: endonuclease/exonuclease/phosphatase family protein [Actinobacteria bacterium]|nr:endonuclease/exonuclease/phosphatase family protein [Actinomycetota bacterium]
MTLKVMEFNIEYGGTTIDFAKVVEAVKAADPDVIGLEEAETNTSRLAKAAGYEYWSNAMQVVSRYPLLEPPDAHGSYLFVQLEPGFCIALSNVHLPSDAPGPTMIRKGKTADQVIAMEDKVRLPYIQTQLEVLPPLVKQGIPVFLLGDFNAPSHLDYTEAVAGTRDYVKYPLEWPVSKAVEAAGFVDSWRAVFPDPLQSLGLTWWAARPQVDGSNPGPNAPQDRIDFIYSAGPAKATAAQLAGEKGGPEVTFAVKPWPSDHRAVMTTFAVTPGPLPVMIAVSPQVATVGDPVTAFYKAAPGGAAAVAVVPVDGAPADALESPAIAVGSAHSGSVEVPTQALDLGKYELLLVGAGNAVQARAPFWVQAPGAKPLLTTDKTAYASGAPMVVTWERAPANRWDWLGVYKATAADPNVDAYLIWQYTGGAGSGTSAGTVAGAMTMDKATVEGSPWPLPTGKYVLYYLLADGYEWVAKTTFRVN